MNLVIHDIRIINFLVRIVAPKSVVCDLQALTPAGPAWTSDGLPLASTVLRVYSDRPRPGVFEVQRDNKTIWSTTRQEELPPYLAWVVIEATLQHLKTTHLLFHGGAVSRGRHGMILPAASQSGKTTLVAGLLAAGFSYFSDDVIVLESTRLELVPFAKCLSIKPGSMSVLGELFSGLQNGTVPHSGSGVDSIWYLPPPAESWPEASAPVCTFVAPQYVSDGPTRLKPIPRSTALQYLLNQSFNLGAQGALGMARAVKVLKNADCYALDLADLRAAVDIVARLVDC
jgi:hypothetical protein